MKLNKLAFIGLTTIIGFTPLSALALDARDFADKLSQALFVSSALEATFEQAIVEGDDIILSDIKVTGFEQVPELSAIMENFNKPIRFVDVKETEDGGYSAQRAIFEDVNFTVEDVDVSISDIYAGDILIPANPEEDILGSLLLYKEMYIGPVSISKNDQEIFAISSIKGTNEFKEEDNSLIGSFEVRDIRSDLSKIEDEEARVGLAALGLTSLRGDIFTDMSWGLEDGRLRIAYFNVDFDNIGRLGMLVDLTGYTFEIFEQLNGLSAELAGLDPASKEYEEKIASLMMSMAAQISLVEVGVGFEDYGITGKILDIFAAQQGTTRENMIPGLAMMASAFLAEFNVPELQEQISEAVSAFLSDPKNIEIKIKPTNPAPITSFIVLASDPQALIKLLNVSVSANK